MANNLSLTSAAYSTGKFGQALSGGRGTVTNPIPTNGTFTVEAQIIGGTPSALKVAVGAAGTFWIGTDNTGKGIAHYGNGGAEIALTSTTTITDGVYHHVELVLSPSGGKFFIDGVLVASNATTMTGAGAVYTDTFGIRTFAGNAYNWDIGDVDEVVIWSTARHSANFTPPTVATPDNSAGLVALWHLDGNGLDSATAGGDTTAPNLSSPTGTQTGQTTATGTVSTDEANGTLYRYASTNATETATTVKAAALTTTVTATGVQSVSFSGLTAGTTYYAHYVHRDAAGNDSAVANSASFTTAAASPSLYTRIDTADTIGGQAITVLVPSSGSANPYSGAATGAILYVHGYGEDETTMLSGVQLPCTQALLDAGYIVAASHAHGDNFGAQTAVDDMAGLAKYLQDNYNISGFAIWSQSMGGLAGLQAITQNKVPKLRGWLGTYPMCSLAANYGVSGWNFTTQINTAFGITGTGNATYANKTYGHDPSLKPAVAFKHLPMRFYASPSDSLVIKTQHTNVLQAIVAGSCRESDIVVCTGDHGDASHFQPTDYVSFFGRCFGTPVALSGSLGAVQAATTARTVTLTLADSSNAARANLTGLKWAFFDTVTPNLFAAPVSQGTAETTDASGVLVITVQTTLASGATGWLVVTDSDGTATQSPSHKAFSGPVVVS
jgi:hypothetical protein